MPNRRRNPLVWGALFLLVGAGCATGIIADPGDGAAAGDSTAADMDGGGDGQAGDSGKADTGKADSGNPDTGACSDWAGPTVTAPCTDMCNTTTHICGPNGCYNMWWCKISTGVCSAKPPTGC